MPTPGPPNAVRDFALTVTDQVLNGDTAIFQGIGGNFSGVIATHAAVNALPGTAAGNTFIIELKNKIDTIPYKGAIGRTLTLAYAAVLLPPQMVQIAGVVHNTVRVMALPGGFTAMPPGSSLVLRDPKATMAGVVGDEFQETYAAGQALNPLVVAAYLQGATDLCGSASVTAIGGGTTTTIVATGGGPFTEFDSLIGATVTILTSPATPANVGCSATVASAGAGVTLTCTDFLDANGDPIAQFPGAIAAADTFSLALDLADDLIAQLRGPGADRTTVVSALMQFKKKVNPTNDEPQLSLNEVNQVAPVALGTTALLTAAYDNTAVTGDTTLTVQMDQAIGDLPFPRVGSLRVVDYHTGVGANKNGSGVFLGDGTGYVPYTRERRSNVLNLGATNLLAGNFNVGAVVQINPRTSGLQINQGWSPEVTSNQVGELIFQQTQLSVDAYVVLA